MIQPIPELLSPAGDEAALRAAIDCGADAVYLGYKAYGARASAANFDDEALSAAVAYAHLYHARVHVAVNTLIKEKEFSGVSAALSAIQQAKADAVIVQDLGVAQMVRDSFPSLELHASTQLAFSNATDAAYAKEFGFTRVVLARECALDTVRQVVATGIETEVFAHGALCAGVSGRCLMSSMAGGRSGNRGRCAQPCRMQMSLNGHSGALLSLKDLCTLRDLPAIVNTGVASLKIEGRLKSPEYVAVVTEIYRNALDAIAAGSFDPDDPAPLERLMQIFNRGGFTRGHIMSSQDAELCAAARTGHDGLPMGKVVAIKGQLAQVKVSRALHNGDSLQIRAHQDVDLRYSGPEVDAGSIATLRLRPDVQISANCDVARLCDAAQLESARLHKPRPIFISIDASFKAGMPMRLSLNDGEVSVTVMGETVQNADRRAATLDDAQRQLAKLGDTPYALASPGDLRVALDEGVFLPVSALNALRRDAVALLTQRRLDAFCMPPRTHTLPSPQAAAPASACISAQTLAVSFCQAELASSLKERGADLLIYHPADYREAALDAALDKLPAGVWLDMPAQASESALQAIERVIARHQAQLGGIVAESFGHLGFKTTLPIIAGDKLPVTNRAAMAALAAASPCAFTLWPELSFAEQLNLAPLSPPALLKVYGRETLMLLNHCPERAARGMMNGRDGCGLCSGDAMACGIADAELKDQKEYSFPLRRTMMPEGCILSVLNALPTSLAAFDHDRIRLNACMLLAFTTESASQQLELTAAFASLLHQGTFTAAAGTTAGHWRRGVE